MSDLTSELLAAMVAATPERKAEALRVLRGEVQAAPRTGTAGPQLMQIKDAADYLGVSRYTVRRMIRSGQLQRVPVTRRMGRVRRVDLDKIAKLV